MQQHAALPHTDDAPNTRNTRSAHDAPLRPLSLAILGASDTPAKLSGRPVGHLRRFGIAGRILPVNAHREQVQGLPRIPRPGRDRR